MKILTELDKRTLGVRQFFDELPSYIIPVQKSIPPYMPFTDGYGYLGVMLLDTEKDRVQCHFCGYWFKALSAHLRVHKMTTNQYKDKIGLYRKEALMSLRTRKKFADAMKDKTYDNIKDHVNKFVDKQYRERAQAKFSNGSTKIQWKNRYGTCEAQLKFRLEELVKKYGRVPTTEEAGKFHSVLERRFGSWTKGLIHYGYTPTYIPSLHRRGPGGQNKGMPKNVDLDIIMAPQCLVCGKVIPRNLKNNGKLQPRDKWLNKKTCSAECLDAYIKNKYPVQSCSFSGCTNKYKARGYCLAHYLKFIKQNRNHLKKVFV